MKKIVQHIQQLFRSFQTVRHLFKNLPADSFYLTAAVIPQSQDKLVGISSCQIFLHYPETNSWIHHDHLIICEDYQFEYEDWLRMKGRSAD